MKPKKTDKTRFSEENQAYETLNPDFRIKIGNSNPKILFYLVLPGFLDHSQHFFVKVHYLPHHYVQAVVMNGLNEVRSSDIERVNVVTESSKVPLRLDLTLNAAKRGRGPA